MVEDGESSHFCMDHCRGLMAVRSKGSTVDLWGPQQDWPSSQVMLSQMVTKCLSLCEQMASAQKSEKTPLEMSMYAKCKSEFIYAWRQIELGNLEVNQGISWELFDQTWNLRRTKFSNTRLLLAEPNYFCGTQTHLQFLNGSSPYYHCAHPLCIYCLCHHLSHFTCSSIRCHQSKPNLHSKCYSTMAIPSMKPSHNCSPQKCKPTPPTSCLL